MEKEALEMLGMLKFREDEIKHKIKFYEETIASTEFEAVRDMCVNRIKSEKEKLEEAIYKKEMSGLEAIVARYKACSSESKAE